MKVGRVNGAGTTNGPALKLKAQLQPPTTKRSADLEVLNSLLSNFFSHNKDEAFTFQRGTGTKGQNLLHQTTSR